MKRYDQNIWDGLQHAMKRLRGHNKLRGRVHQFPGRGELWLEVEARGPQAAAGWLKIQVGPDAKTSTWQHGEVRRALSEFESPVAFLEAAAERCRQGRAYLHTNMTTATYKT
jgi:hypothetical protein